jgi:hypothetical protein
MNLRYIVIMHVNRRGSLFLAVKTAIQSKAAIMGKIYEQSYLTIAASGATNSTEGCIVDRPHENIVQIPGAAKHGKLLYVRHFLRNDVYYGKSDTSLIYLDVLGSGYSHGV